MSETCEHAIFFAQGPGMWTAVCKKCVTRWTSNDDWFSIPEDVRTQLVDAYGVIAAGQADTGH